MDLATNSKFQFSRKAMLLFAEVRLGFKQMEWERTDEYWDSVYLTYGTIYSYFLELDEYFAKIKRKTTEEKIIYFNLGELFMNYNRILMNNIFSYLDEIYNEDIDEEDEIKLNLTGQYDRLLLMVEGLNSSIDVDKIVMSEEIIDEILADLENLEVASPLSDIICNYLDDVTSFLDATSSIATQGEY